MTRIYGRASGIVGLRLFPNPDFDAAARARWDAQRFYNDPRYYRDRTLVRPYRVGMACGFCHVGPHPLHPPADPEQPEWRNLSSNIGDQYFRPAGVFVLPQNEDNFLFQVVNSMPPGTIDTSALATDNLNNPRNMNAIYDFGTRIAIGAHEQLAGGNLDMIGTKPEMPVPHVLKDGADSIGILGALARVYVSIGSDHREWIKHFNLIVGGKKQTPFPVAQARKDSPYFRATLDRLPNVAAFFVAAAKPQPLARAPGGEAYLQDGADVIARGQQLFAENCAACHVNPNKMPAPPSGVARYSPPWDAWTRSDDFKSKMTALVRAPDFLEDNYLSTDRPYPDSRIGTNACAAVASNAVRGHIWDNFSSETYKERPAAGAIGVLDPFSGQMRPFVFPAGGRGYQRAPSLISIWASAPYLHNNSVGVFTGDPSVKGRMRAFEDGMEKLLWPEKRPGSIYRTTQTSWLYVERSYLPKLAFNALKKSLGLPKTATVIRLGPIPKGTPVNLLANIDLDLTLDPIKLLDFGSAAVKLNAALREIDAQKLNDDAAAARLKELAPLLLKLSKCPDLVTDHGHLFGTGLPDADKRALIAFLKRL
ncbi:MAG: cytochrome c [Acidobacteriia bacterium]|nr:cytochrome c [Terriglobia bacterium]